MLPWVIILLGIIIIIINIRGIFKGNNTVLNNEGESFNEILKKEKVNNDRDYDKEIIAIRRDLAETVLDLQKEIEELRVSLNYFISYNKIDKLDDNINIEKIKNDDNKVKEKENINLDENVISEINFSHKDHKTFQKEKNSQEEKKDDKVQKVKELIEEGLSDEEICNKLSIGKGEVLLIKGLLK